jgi:hypothetical protein
MRTNAGPCFPFTLLLVPAYCISDDGPDATILRVQILEPSVLLPVVGMMGAIMGNRNFSEIFGARTGKVGTGCWGSHLLVVSTCWAFTQTLLAWGDVDVQLLFFYP